MSSSSSSSSSSSGSGSGSSSSSEVVVVVVVVIVVIVKFLLRGNMSSEQKLRVQRIVFRLLPARRCEGFSYSELW